MHLPNSDAVRPIKWRGRKALEMIWSVGAYGGARFPSPSTKVEAVPFVPNSYGKSPTTAVHSVSQKLDGVVIVLRALLARCVIPASPIAS